MSRWRTAWQGRFGLLLAASVAGCGEPPPELRHYTVPASAESVRQSLSCRNRNPDKNAYFGDLHVHTALSSDAWMFDVRVRPDDAYRYAFGEPILLPPLNEHGEGTREVRIDRPLDFAAVTDHAEFLGEMALCTDEGHPQYRTDFCQTFREGSGRSFQLAKLIMLPSPWRNNTVCGADGADCRRATGALWQEVRDAAERWNDAGPECERTTLVAYEYTSHRLGSNLHRNVIFRNAIVPALPVSYIEAQREWDLWRLLKQGCIDTDSGCDALAIPHNANISNGRMFNVEYVGTDSREEEVERARLRMALEPIIEVMQHKGDSECRDGMPGVLGSEDELCGFEKFARMSAEIRTGEPPTENDLCREGPFADLMPHLGPDCLSRLNYARYALIEGLREQERIGVNPFKFGLAASTDTHNGLPGGVEERSYPGHLGVGDDTVAKRVAWDADVPGNTSNNPGGLIGVWAEQNNREAIFDAIRRKEVFGTSGPRIQPRFFAGGDWPQDLCEAPDMIARAYQSGVPMGGDLPASRVGEQGPMFLATALADTGTRAAPGNALQRLQIVKGWVDAEGARRQRVYEVAGDPDNGAGVDRETCAPRGEGFGQLCAVWRDPDFNPDLRSVYYLRAVENPSCRYNAWQCAGLQGDARPAACDSDRAPKVIQERAWSSPIWYTPETSDGDSEPGTQRTQRTEARQPGSVAAAQVTAAGDATSP